MLAAALGNAAGHATNKQAISAADIKIRAEPTENNPSSTPAVTIGLTPVNGGCSEVMRYCP
jgi:hypothetical protein